MRATYPASVLVVVVVIVAGFIGAGNSVCRADTGDICPGAAMQLALDDVRVENNLAGVAVGVSYDGGCEWYGASGLANVDTGRAFEPDDYFRVGSITKTFTSAVVLQLMEEGVLNLEDTLAEWMPEYPGWSEITLRQLLSHTSGIHDVTNDPDSDFHNGELWPPADTIGLAATYPLDFESGTDYGYCNVNYLILGKIIEAATGDTWIGQVRMRLLDPTGLGHTFAESDEEIPGGLQVHGYWDASEDLTDDTWQSETWSAGAMVSTTADIAHFVHALFGGGLLEPETVDEMVTPSPFSSYGLGVENWDTDAGPMYHNRGHVWGYRSIYTYFPDAAASFALFTNESNTNVLSLSDPFWSLVFPTTSAVAAAAHQPGAAGTSWVTDAVLFNSGSEPAYVELRYHQVDLDNSSSNGVAVRIDARTSIVLSDLVEATFDRGDSSGALLIIAPPQVVVTSRTYNDDAAGTFGQFIPAVPENRWVSGTDPAVLLQLTGTDRFRTNIGFANLGPDELDLTVDLFAAGAGAVDTLTATLAPYSYDQLNNVFAGHGVVDDAYAMVRAGSKEAEYLAYASVVDNATGDPTYIAPVEGSSDVIYIPAAAHVGGIGDTNWRTDLELYSAGDVDATYRVEWLPESQANPDPLAATFTLGRGECARYGDVVGEIFDASGAGALRITVDHGKVMSTSRTYNDLGDRTYGQAVPGLTLNGALAGGELVGLAGLAYSADPQQGFRTNIGLVNATGDSLPVLMYLYLDDSTLLGTLVKTLEPYAYLQLTDVFAEITDQDVSNGYATVKCLMTGAQYYAWASVVDNRSGDPVFIPAQPPAAE